MRSPRNNNTPVVIIRRKKPVAEEASPPASASVVSKPDQGMLAITVKDFCDKCAEAIYIEDVVSAKDVKSESHFISARMNLLYIQLKKKINNHICKGKIK